MKKEDYRVVFSLPVVIVVLLIISLSCRKKEADYPVIAAPPADTIIAQQPSSNSSGKKFLALGDSYTIGQSVDSSERYPAQTVALLSAQNIAFAPIQYIATTGWTTSDLAEGIATRNPKGPFDVVTLLIGVNDQYQAHDTVNYRSRFSSLLNTAVSLAGNNKSHVFVLSIPDYGVTPFGGNNKEISNQIDQFNAINKNVTDNDGISYTDITVISRNDAGDTAAIAKDGLHPSGKQYAQWTQALEPSVFKALQ